MLRVAIVKKTPNESVTATTGGSSIGSGSGSPRWSILMINRSPTPSRVSVRLPAAWWPPASTGEERAGRGVNVSAGDTVRRWSYTVEEATTRERGAAGVEGDAGLDEFGDLPHYDKLLRLAPSPSSSSQDSSTDVISRSVGFTDDAVPANSVVIYTSDFEPTPPGNVTGLQLSFPSAAANVLGWDALPGAVYYRVFVRRTAAAAGANAAAAGSAGSAGGGGAVAAGSAAPLTDDGEAPSGGGTKFDWVQVRSTIDTAAVFMGGSSDLSDYRVLAVDQWGNVGGGSSASVGV